MSKSESIIEKLTLSEAKIEELEKKKQNFNQKMHFGLRQERIE